MSDREISLEEQVAMGKMLADRGIDTYGLTKIFDYIDYKIADGYDFWLVAYKIKMNRESTKENSDYEPLFDKEMIGKMTSNVCDIDIDMIDVS